MPAFKILDSFAAPSEAQTKGDGVDTAHANIGNVRIIYTYKMFVLMYVYKCIYIYIIYLSIGVISQPATVNSKG